LLLASSAGAHIFDPAGSFIYLQLGALPGNSVPGQPGAVANGTLTGGPGSEVIVSKGKGMGLPNLFQAVGVTRGENFFTGTIGVDNLFFTVQNTDGTFVHGTNKGTFQGNTLCTSSCFGGQAGILGQVLVRIPPGFDVPVALDFIGGGGKSTVGPAGQQFRNEGAQWVTGDVQITGIATNIHTITNNGTAKGGINARAGATGIGFTLQFTVNENTDLQQENGVSTVTVRGTTAFQTASATSGVNQVTLVSPVFSDASDVTMRPPVPGVAVMVLRYVPEPGALVLLGAAVGGLLLVGRSRMKR